MLYNDEDDVASVASLEMPFVASDANMEEDDDNTMMNGVPPRSVYATANAAEEVQTNLIGAADPSVAMELNYNSFTLPHYPVIPPYVEPEDEALERFIPDDQESFYEAAEQGDIEEMKLIIMKYKTSEHIQLVANYAHPSVSLFKQLCVCSIFYLFFPSL